MNRPGETDRADDELAEQAAAVLRGMAEHGIRIDDRAFERFTTTLLAEYDRRGAEIQRLRAAQCNALCSDIEHERDQLRQQRAAALALIDDLLHPWNTGRRVHPGYEGVEAGFQYKRHVDEWNARRAALGAADEPTTGGPRVSIPMEQLHSHTPYVIDVVNSERQRAEREHYNRETARLLGSTVADVEPTTGGGSDA